MNASVAPDPEFPALYKAADLNSVTSQRRFLTATKIRLMSLVLAAIFGTLAWSLGGSDLAGILAAVTFSGALGAELYLLRVKPDRIWYQGRAADESVKTLTWRYL